MKILYLYFGATSPVVGYERRLINNISQTERDIEIEFWDWTSEYKLKINPSILWAKKNISFLQPFYKKLKQKSKAVDVVFIAQTGGILPEIMADLPALIAYNTADDPESSELCSFPFLESADVIVHAGANFDAITKMGDEFLKRGAKRCVFMPIGFYDEMFPEINNFNSQFLKRDIPIIYVGNPKHGIFEKIARYFRRQIKIFYRSLTLHKKIYWFVTTGNWIGSFDGNLYNLYQRSQIGINLHHSYGPSNVRTYQLNAAGVAQVLDCPEGNTDIYIPDDEILSYRNFEEAIEKIDLLLKNDELRYKIAKSGYERARSSYNRKDLLLNMFRSL